MIVNKKLDVCKLRCPEPIMLLRKTIREMKTNEVLLVIADDFASQRDIPNFCRHMNHDLLKSEVNQTPYYFWIKK